MRYVGALAMVLLVLLVSASGASAAAPPHVSVVQTNADLSARLTALPARRFTPGTVYGVPVIAVDDGTRYQRIGGFGAAMTDSSAWLLERAASPDAGREAMAALFGSGGIRIGLARVPMGASDFTAAGQPYSYDDLPAGQSDPDLEHFSVDHDAGYVLPALRQARALNPHLQLLATPWSPPAWMKANDALSNLVHRGTLLPRAAGAWAMYFVKFLESYRSAGVPINAISMQNEPDNATSYPGLQLPALEAGALLVHRLLPALRSAGLRPKVYGGEQGWGPSGRAYSLQLARDPSAHSLSGLAWHCYFGTPSAMDGVRALTPGLDQIVSECATGLVPFPASEILIGSLRHWASSVALWNIALDPHGGPVEAPNTGCPGCTGLLTVDQRTGNVTPTLAYYQLGQVSRYVQPGAVRVSSEHYVDYHYDWKHMTQSIVSPGIDDAAFLNPDGSRVLVVYANQSTPGSFAVQWRDSWFVYTLPARATVTFTWHP